MRYTDIADSAPRWHCMHARRKSRGRRQRRRSAISVPHLWHQLSPYVGVKGPSSSCSQFLCHETPTNFDRAAGTTEEKLDEAERKLGVRFPDDLRCCYRIHNGQRLASPGWVNFCFGTFVLPNGNATDNLRRTQHPSNVTSTRKEALTLLTTTSKALL